MWIRLFSLFFILVFSQKNEHINALTYYQKKNINIMNITSTSFKPSDYIPKEHTCDGINISPELTWLNCPINTKTFAIICDDPDAPAGDWVHWIIYNIPKNINNLPPHLNRDIKSKYGDQGINDFKKIGYDGPCPPNGTHRYFFKIYALDTTIPFDKNMTKSKLLKNMEGHIIATASLMGKYSRK
jgi:hypothetical protein